MAIIPLLVRSHTFITQKERPIDTQVLWLSFHLRQVERPARYRSCPSCVCGNPLAFLFTFQGLIDRFLMVDEWETRNDVEDKKNADFDFRK
jgi:hypothetical protein